MDPIVAFRLSLRLPHLAARMKEHSTRAMYCAKQLESNGHTVVYPGLPSHPDHAFFTENAHNDYGYGGLFTLDMGSSVRANQLMDLLQNKYRFGYMAVSLGYFETLMSCSGSSTSSEMDEEAQSKAGISPGLIRFSIGLTGSIETRWKHMKEAIELCSSH
jgi:methionine-gamma-lyase